MSGAKTIKIFRAVAMAEGISFLVLLGIAMPLKYFADSPMAVRIVGLLHGVLFVAFIALAWETTSVLNKKLSWFVKAFVASIIPFGTFLLDKELKKEADAIGR